MKRNNRLTQMIAAAAGCLVIAASGYAQNLEQGKVEGAAQVGIVADLGTRASLAGSVGTALSDRVFAFGEFGWIPLGGGSISTASPGSFLELANSGRVLTFMFGGHYAFDESHSVIPYLGAAIGGVHQSASFTRTEGGVSTTTTASRGNFYVNLSAGARYYVKDNWGLKPEVTWFVGDDNFIRFGGGVFYTFGR